MGSFSKLFKRAGSDDRNSKRSSAHLSPPVDLADAHKHHVQRTNCSWGPRDARTSPVRLTMPVAGLGIHKADKGRVTLDMDHRKDKLLHRQQRRKSSGSMDKLAAVMTSVALEPQTPKTQRPVVKHSRTRSEPVVYSVSTYSPHIQARERAHATHSPPTNRGIHALQRPLPPTPPSIPDVRGLLRRELYPQAYPSPPRPPLPPRPRGPNPVRQSYHMSSTSDIAKEIAAVVPASPLSVASPVLPGAFPNESPPRREPSPPPPPYIEAAAAQRAPGPLASPPSNTAASQPQKLIRPALPSTPPRPCPPVSSPSQPLVRQAQPAPQVRSATSVPLSANNPSASSCGSSGPSFLPYLNSPTPTVHASFGSPSQDRTVKNQCCGTTGAGKRCTRIVTVTSSNSPRKSPLPANKSMMTSAVDLADAVLTRDGQEPVTRFCFQHAKQALGERGCFVELKGRQAKWIEFDDWILSDLPDSTRAALRYEMALPVTNAERGYLYVHEMVDKRCTRTCLLKLGRSVQPVLRLAQWRSQCPSREPVVRGIFPQQERNSPRAGLSTTINVAEEGLPNHRKWERLCLIELAGRSEQFLRGSSGNVGSTRCKDCGKVHVELFELDSGAYDDWVKEMVERWGRWCRDVLE
ncbi:hypothetical protein ACM66B_001664 [Microbotryomycetes sp. NB124-2]